MEMALRKNEEEEEEIICLGESFFVNRDYQLTNFTFGTHSFNLFCLRSASTDYDLTGQIVWPGAVLMNNYLSQNPNILHGRSMIELGSGVGITGILCSKFCREVVLTDHNEEVLEVLRKNTELHSIHIELSSPVLTVKKLEWGNNDHLREIIDKRPCGFDLVLGADICFQHSSVPPLFSTVKKLLSIRGSHCKFILAYVSRAKVMDALVINEGIKQGMQIREVHGTRSVVSNLEGVIYEITLDQSPY